MVVAAVAAEEVDWAEDPLAREPSFAAYAAGYWHTSHGGQGEGGVELVHALAVAANVNLKFLNELVGFGSYYCLSVAC